MASALLNGGAGEGGRAEESSGEKPGDAAVRGAERKKEHEGPPVESGSGGRQGGIAASGGTDDRFDARDGHPIFVVDRI